MTKRATAGLPVFDWDHEGWREHAACRLCDADMFFPIGSTGSAVEEIQAAKAVCRHCPVRLQCLRFALDTNQETGIWGGTDDEERRRLRRTAKMAAIRGRLADA